jgi:hypothetical protein
MNLENLGVQEMNTTEMKSIDGGIGWKEVWNGLEKVVEWVLL